VTTLELHAERGFQLIPDNTGESGGLRTGGIIPYLRVAPREEEERRRFREKLRDAARFDD